MTISKIYSMQISTPIQINSLQQMRAWGQRLGGILHAGDIVLLYGEMGSGKTTLCKSICGALGIHEMSVISPTYTIVNVYQGRIKVHHVDLYRLQSVQDLDAFDEVDLLCEEGISLIEWPHLLASWEHLNSAVQIKLEDAGDEKRNLTITWTDPRLSALLLG